MTTVHCMLGDVSMISFSARGAVLTLAQSALVIQSNVVLHHYV